MNCSQSGSRIAWLGLVASLFFLGPDDSSGALLADSKDRQVVALWDRFEVSVTNSSRYANPFQDVELNAVFTRPGGREVRFFGFYDGDGHGGQSGPIWKLRFMPDEAGVWHYRSAFSDGSSGREGSFECRAESSKPGPLRADGATLRFANGKIFFPRGYRL